MKFESSHWVLEKNDSKYFEILFEEIRPQIAPIYKYKQGNCHNLAHFASLLLSRAGVPHKKIWIYAPSRIAVESKTSISIPDVNQLSPTGMLNWGYHVALWIEFETKAFVFDYMMDDTKPLKLSEWLDSFGLSKYKIDIQEPEKYLFYGIKYNGRKNLLFSGNYFTYEGLCREEAWISKGLAVNETAYEFFKQENEHFLNQTEWSEDYRLLVGRVINFECIFRDSSYNKRMTKAFQKKHSIIIEKYRKIYAQKIEKWHREVELLLGTKPME